MTCSSYDQIDSAGDPFGQRFGQWGSSLVHPAHLQFPFEALKFQMSLDENSFVISSSNLETKYCGSMDENISYALNYKLYGLVLKSKRSRCDSRG